MENRCYVIVHILEDRHVILGEEISSVTMSHLLTLVTTNGLMINSWCPWYVMLYGMALGSIQRVLYVWILIIMVFYGCSGFGWLVSLTKPYLLLLFKRLRDFITSYVMSILIVCVGSVVILCLYVSFGYLSFVGVNINDLLYDLKSCMYLLCMWCCEVLVCTICFARHCLTVILLYYIHYNIY